MADSCCGNCRHSFDVSEMGDYSDRLPLRCRRFPPVRSDPDSVMGYWPAVGVDGFCGEYQPGSPETVDDVALAMARCVMLGDMTAARALADKLRE